MDIAKPAAESIQGEVERSFEEEADFLAELIAARSPTGEEGPAAELLERWLREEGFDPETEIVPAELRDRHPALADELDLEQRPNVYGWWRSADAAAAPLVLNGHLDVVPADPEEWSHDPYGDERSEGRIWGRGSTDMKGGVVTALFAVRALRRLGLKSTRDVQIQGVMAEETGGLGTLAALASQPRPAGAIVLEPTGNLLAPACGGNLQFRVHVEGTAAHTAVPWHGVSAAEKLWVVYTAIQEFSRGRNAAVSHPLFDALPEAVPTGVGIFRAGDYHSTLPAAGMLAGRVGVIPGDRLEDVKAGLLSAVAATGDPWLAEHPPRLEWIHEGFAAWETPTTAPLVEAMVEGFAAVRGERRMEAVTYGSDAGHFAQAGVPTVLYGPGSIVDAHRVDESLSERDLLDATKVLACGLSVYLSEESS